MRSLSRVLRLATVLSATPSSSSSPLARYESSTTVDMPAVLARAAAVTTASRRVAALSRARLVRRRPGFVRSTAISTSTSTQRAAHTSSGQHVASLSQFATKPEVGRRHGSHNPHREASHPASRGASASLEQWFSPSRRSLGRSLRLYSADAVALRLSSATVDKAADHIASPDVRAHSSTGGGTDIASREDAGEGEGEGGEGGDGAAPFKVSGWCHVQEKSVGVGIGHPVVQPFPHVSPHVSCVLFYEVYPRYVITGCCIAPPLSEVHLQVSSTATAVHLNATIHHVSGLYGPDS